MKAFVAAVALIVLLASPARSAFETLVPIVQPVESDGGPEPTVTTYSVYIGNDTGAETRMLLTVAPNAIISSSRVAVDRNLASAHGIKLSCVQKADTLVVQVDLASAKSMDPSPEYAAREVALTLWCGLRNVRAAWPSVKYVQYKLEGNLYLVHYAGIYRLETVDLYVAKDTWDLAVFGPDEARRPTGR